MAFVFLVLRGIAGSAMVAPPLEQQHLDPVPVGKFPWRLAPAQRAGHESVSPGQQARIMSPYTEVSDEVPVSPDMTADELRIQLSGQEPFWYTNIMPLWPSVWQQTALYVPVPPCRQLVCIAVVAPGWQMAAIIPTRADLPWVLAYLRRCTPGSLMSIRAPISIQSAMRSDSEAADWRNGDVVLAFQFGSDHDIYQAPIFRQAGEVGGGVELRL